MCTTAGRNFNDARQADREQGNAGGGKGGRRHGEHRRGSTCHSAALRHGCNLNNNHVRHKSAFVSSRRHCRRRIPGDVAFYVGRIAGGNSGRLMLEKDRDQHRDSHHRPASRRRWR